MIERLLKVWEHLADLIYVTMKEADQALERAERAESAVISAARRAAPTLRSKNFWYLTLFAAVTAMVMLV